MKSVIVNLKRRPDRKENTNNVFREHGVKEFEFFEAVDGKELQPTQFIQQLFLGNDFNWRRGVIGCALSHLNLWKELINSTLNFYCIFEDDITLSLNFNTSFQKSLEYMQVNPNVDLLFLGYHMFKHLRDQIKEIYDTERDVSFSKINNNLYIGGTFAYIISKEGAKKMLKYIENNGIKHGIDYVMKINPLLNTYECQPLIVQSEWVDTENSKVDSDIQKDPDSLIVSPTGKIVEIKEKKYLYYQGLDSSGHDLYFVGKQPIEILADIAERDPNCVAFNSLGFMKSQIQNITSTQWIHPIDDGVYIKLEYLQKLQNIQTLDSKSSSNIRVKMICDWCSSQQLCNEWNHMSQGNFKWNNIQIVPNDDNIDYYVIINKPRGNEFYDPKKTIVFQMEPWCYSPNQHWGVKTWGQWAKPDENKFLQVRTHEKFLNNAFWQLKTTYTQFKTEPIIKNEKYGNTISTICSSKYFDPGHIKRIDFIKYIEERNDPSVIIHIYNHDNNHNFKNYQGPHPPGNKDVGITPYKYYFMGENNEEKNFITEKIYESLLTETLCFYWGCPNISEYFDPLSYVVLDLNDFEKSFNIIKTSIEENLWEKRLSIIRKEKQKVLDYYNFFPTLERIIEYKKYFPKFRDFSKVCFIHSCNLKETSTKILDEIIEDIKTNLSDSLDMVIINNIGIPIDKNYNDGNDKFQIINYSSDTYLFELPTIKLISLFSENNPDCKLLYLHTKGITQNNNQNIEDWRKYMQYFMISKSEKCCGLLDTYDAVGCNFSEQPKKHFSGNFWWANTKYLKSLPVNHLKERHDAEWWVLSNTNNFTSVHNSNINHYHQPYPFKNYRQ